MTEAEAEALLRKDLMKRYALFRRYGKDAELLMVLSYNVGTSALLGYGKRPKSRLLRKLEAGDRDIYREYISYCHYRGRKVKSIERRGCVKIPPFFFLCWPTYKVKSKKIVLYKIKLFLCKVTRFKRYYK